MANDIGYSVKEGTANGATPFNEPSKRNIALLMERERGVENKVRRIVSLSDDRKFFGGFNANMYGPTVVRNMYKNAKNAPLTYFGIRIIGAGCVAATTGVTALEAINHTYTAGQLGEQDKGTWGNNLTTKFYSYNYKTPNKYTLEVYLSGLLVETFAEATMAALQVTINNTSYYVMATLSAEYTLPAYAAGAGTISVTNNSTAVTGSGTAFTSYTVGSILRIGSTDVGVIASIGSATALTLEKTYEGTTAAAQAFTWYKRFKSTFTLTGGVYNAPVESNFYAGGTTSAPTGLNLLKGVDCQIIAVTENHTQTMASELRDFCTAQNLSGVAVPPLNATESQIQAYATAFQSNNVEHLAFYHVWAKTSDESTGYIVVPALGHVLGAAYIRVPYLQGDMIHIPPGGIDSAFVDVVECYPKVIDQPTINLYVKTYTMNIVKFTERVGWWVVSSRTTSTNPLYHSVHIRLQTAYYMRVLLENLGWVAQKPNTPQLKREMYVAIYAFFKTEYQRGALERSIPFEEACAIICDVTNNPPSQLRTELNMDVNWIPTEVAEAVKTSLNRNDGILIVS